MSQQQKKSKDLNAQDNIIYETCMIKSKSDSNEKYRKRYVNETCVQIIAWVFLTVGLCTITIVFYLALHYREQNDKQPRFNYDDDDDDTTEWDVGGELLDENYDVNIGDKMYDEQDKPATKSNLTSHLMAYNEYYGCTESLCRIVCSRNNPQTFYDDVTAAFDKRNKCNGIVPTLLLVNQNLNSLKHKWLTAFPTPKKVYRIVLRDSNVSHICNGAFNAPMFATTLNMIWHNIKVEELKAGALLGLYALQQLKIVTKLPSMNLAFLQPVQSTLRYLRLNAYLKFHTNSSIFGNALFDKMEYIDLSYNYINGALNKRMFASTPNLKFLYIKSAAISAIEADTFDNFADKLHVIDLSNNLLTTLSAGVLLPLLRSSAGSRTYFELESNQWSCDCELFAFAALYTAYRNNFMSSLHCKRPIELYGTNLNEFDANKIVCGMATTPLTERVPVFTTTTNIPRTTTTTTALTTTTTPNTATTTPIIPSEAIKIPTTTTTTDAYESISIDEMITTTEAYFSDKISIDCMKPTTKKSIEIVELEPKELKPTAMEQLTIEPPEYELVLTLFLNRSVVASIYNFDDYDTVNIIWFNDPIENDYNCMSYTNPYLLIETLRPNVTYTFCLMVNNTQTVSPLNCQPLHVPAIQKNEYGDFIDNVFEDNDKIETEKQFTIGILCLIFFMSAVFGASIAYLGIKTYPDLLEGSKNVLVVKKSDKTCYISTIMDTENALKHETSVKKNSLPDSFKKPKTPLPELPQKPTNMSAKDLMRLSSQKSSSTCFEESFPNFSNQDEEYEIPKSFQQSFYSLKRCVENPYAVSPKSPPPLPKRNSNISENLVTNRFGKLNEAFEHELNYN